MWPVEEWPSEIEDSDGEWSGGGEGDLRVRREEEGGEGEWKVIEEGEGSESGLCCRLSLLLLLLFWSESCTSTAPLSSESFSVLFASFSFAFSSSDSSFFLSSWTTLSLSLMVFANLTTQRSPLTTHHSRFFTLELENW